MKQLGDITEINGAKIEPVDCITFGSPCQDLSVAGKRKGLTGERSGLFMEAIRIIKEMRKKDETSSGTDELIRPRFAIWENVPGAFSSNNGYDFKAVLEELVRIREPDVAIPEPEKRHTKRGDALLWKKAGAIDGDGWSLAWRTFDAQYWGVPQRRKRIALVVDFAGGCAGEILFERESVSGDSSQSVEPWKGIARNPEHGITADDKLVERTFCLQGNGIGRKDSAGCNGKGYTENVAYTLNTIDQHAVAYRMCSMASNSMKSNNPHSGTYETDTSCTLDLNGGNPSCNQGGIMVCEPHLYDMTHANDVIRDCGEIAPSLQARMGTGGNQVPILPICMNMRTGEDIANALKARDCKGVGREDSLGSVVVQAISCEEVAHTLKAKSNCQYREDSETYICERLQCAAIDCRNHKMQSISGTLQAKENGGQSLNYINPVLVKAIRWIVRRLTPTECERLQGFPDGWTDIGEWVDSKEKRHKPADSPRYKALGNSIALPQWWWIICKMADYLPEAATLGSLFDGIGGFPLVWEERHGKKTACWSSEIEEFPMAVTAVHFPE